MDWVIFLRHGRRLIVAGAVLGLLAGLAVGVRSRPAYRARTEVLVRPVLVDPFEATATAGRVINMYTERQRAGSAGVAQRARSRMHTSEGLRTIRSRLEVTVTGSTQLLEFTYRHSNAGQAQEGAQAFAEAYLVTQRETATVLRDDRRARLDAELAPLDAAIAAAEAAVGKAPARSAEASAAKARLRDLTTQAQPYRQTLAAIASVDVAGGGTIVSNARRPTHRGGPSPASAAGAGLALGLLADGTGVPILGAVMLRSGVRERTPLPDG